MKLKSSITTKKTEARRPAMLEIIPPGEVLLEEFMKPLGVSMNSLARDLHVPPNRVHAIVHGKRAITADTALRLAAYFDSSAEFWLNLQSSHDLRLARRTSGGEILRTVRRRDAA
jgi:addiction module HigA family antidote